MSSVQKKLGPVGVGFVVFGILAVATYAFLDSKRTPTPPRQTAPLAPAIPGLGSDQATGGLLDPLIPVPVASSPVSSKEAELFGFILGEKVVKASRFGELCVCQTARATFYVANGSEQNQLWMGQSGREVKVVAYCYVEAPQQQ